ncbi:hypothetical protein DACRYDRAFT_112756 [Dacryopinax primogenitus]|uniref:SH3 domain-containing protein n=1 Tax=Dacryopinax primogenitus (strain DJM 731) TaxID=1858805 RepID=M5GGR1_DACPD|nr:uncharacterized protein DACRYDRAFT_112756 [Dacryopinax primogenitus]EJU05928.1 hypothetical protein DACRYDRAFT_112756 [Dacryopinax primogenitus]
MSLEPTSPVLVMKIRDFAYDETDERHYGKGLEGQGQPKPKPPPERKPFQTNWGFGQAVENDSDLDHSPYPSYDDEDEEDSFERPFVPGLYRCLYDFIPEGTAELPMTAGHLYRIVSRCGPIGWVIMVNADGTTGIVPEGYLTLERGEEDLEEESVELDQDFSVAEDGTDTPTPLETPTPSSSTESMDDDAPPTPHAQDDLSKTITPPSPESGKTELRKPASDDDDCTKRPCLMLYQQKNPHHHH